MKYDITCACGHGITVELYGKSDSRERKLNAMKKAICPECEAKKSMEQAEALNLPILHGSDRQIAWATKIRNDLIVRIENRLKDKLNNFRSALEARKLSENEINKLYNDAEKQAKEVISYVKNDLQKASWWIDNQNISVDIIILTLLKEIASDTPKNNNDVVTHQESELEKEIVTKPDNCNYEEVPKISINDNIINISSPKNEDLRKILKSNGFTWNYPVWSRKITKFNGSVEDRAAEIGNLLLNAGFAVKITDENIRNCAISADYAPECKRWIAWNSEKEMLTISFEYGAKDVYSAARRIPGSRWSSPDVVVPVSSYLSVIDFADLYNFKISSGAETHIEQYKKSIEIVSPAVANAPKIISPEEKLKSILESDKTIIEDLRDDG